MGDIGSEIGGGSKCVKDSDLGPRKKLKKVSGVEVFSRITIRSMIVPTCIGLEQRRPVKREINHLYDRKLDRKNWRFCR